MGTSLGSIFIDLKINLKALDAANKKINGFGKTVNNQMKGAGNAVNKLERSWRKSFRRMSNDAVRLGGILTASLSAPVAGIFKSVIGGSAFDELEFIKLRKLLPVTDERAQEIREGLRETVRRVPLASHEISNVAAEAARLGVAEKYIESFTEVMGKMSFATVLSSTAAATSLARFSNIVKLPLDQIERVASAVVHLGNNFAANEREITKMSLRIGSLSAVAGATIPQILGLSAAFPAVGLFPELVGTSLTRIFVKLQNGIKNSEATAKSLAILTNKSVPEFKSDFYSDQVVGLLDVAEGIKKGANSGVNFAEMLEQIGLDGHRITLVMAFLANNTDLFRAALDKSAVAFEKNIHLQREFDRFMNTLSNQFLLLKNQLNIVKLKLGDQFLPILRKVVQTFLTWLLPVLEEVVHQISKLSDQTRGFILVLGLILFALGPLILAFGILIKVALILGTTIGIIMAAMLLLPVVAAAIVIYWDRIVKAFKELEWGIIALFGAVALLPTAFVLVYMHWDSIVKFFSDTIERMKGFFVDLKDNFVRDMNALWLEVVFIWDKIVGVFKWAGRQIEKVLDPINKFLADKDGLSVEEQIITAGNNTKAAIDESAAKLEAIRAKNREEFISALEKQLPEATRAELEKLAAAEKMMADMLERDPSVANESWWASFKKGVMFRKKAIEAEVKKRSRIDAYDPTANQNRELLEKAQELHDLLEAERLGAEVGETFTEAFTDTFATKIQGSFDKILKGEFSGINDLWTGLIESLTQTWTRFLAEEIAGGLQEAMLKSGVGGFFDKLFKDSIDFGILLNPNNPKFGPDGSITRPGGANNAARDFIDRYQAGTDIPHFATGGIMVGEEGPEIIMNAKATDSYGPHLAALNRGMTGGMNNGTVQHITQNWNFEAGVTPGQMGAALDKFMSEVYRKITQELKEPDSNLRRTVRGTR